MLTQLAMKSALLGASLMSPGTLELPERAPACDIGGPRVKSFDIVWGDTLHEVMAKADAGPRTADELRSAMRRHYNLSNILQGDRLDLGFSVTGEVEWFRYRPSLTAAMCAVRAQRDGWRIRYVDPKVDRDIELLILEAQPSMAVAIEEAGEDPSLEARLEELFPKVVIDEARILIERRSAEGEHLSYARIHAAEVRSGDKRLRAFYFEHPDGRSGHYTEARVPLDPVSLHVPVADGLMVSPYGWRRHPIRRIRRPHRGMDYAAPRDTLVQAAADGVVVQARYYGPLGRLVVIDHGQGLLTRYAHLNRYAPGLKAGVRVHRGDPIGRIGTSGLTTGAHLHFETILNDRHTNPARVMTPAAPPITDDLLPLFEEQVEKLLRQLELDANDRGV